MSDTCVVLDVYGDYAHFRKPSTTSPARSYGIPPRTTVAGMIAAMLGMERDSYYHLFARDNSRIAVSLERQVRRYAKTTNILTTTGNNKSPSGAKVGKSITGNRQQNTFDMICDPRYRLYISLDDDEMMDRMEEMFSAGKSVYSLSLGLSECLASYDYVGRYDIEQRDGDGVTEIRNAIPGEEVNLVPDPDARYVSERLPGFMKARSEGGRKGDGMQRLTYDRGGGAARLRDTAHSVVGDDAVIFA